MLYPVPYPLFVVSFQGLFKSHPHNFPAPVPGGPIRSQPLYIVHCPPRVNTFTTENAVISSGAYYLRTPWCLLTILIQFSLSLSLLTLHKILSPII